MLDRDRDSLVALDASGEHEELKIATECDKCGWEGKAADLLVTPESLEKKVPGAKLHCPLCFHGRAVSDLKLV